MTIKKIIQEIFDNADKIYLSIPIKHAKNLHLILTDSYPHEFLLVMNGNVHDSWPEVISQRDKKPFENIQEVISFFFQARCKVIAYRIAGVETILHVPDFRTNDDMETLYHIPFKRYEPQTTNQDVIN